jgi:hypothetical protein
MNTKQQLETLYLYYNHIRGVGHTYTMLNGLTSNPNAKVVVTNTGHAKTLNLKSEQIIPLTNLEQLYGINCPLVFDNYTLMNLFANAIFEIHHLEKENEEYKERLDSIDQILHK